MPELPEVETVRMGLAPALEGHVITHAHIGRKGLRIPFPPRFVARLEGRKVINLRRRAKYILVDLDSGETLVIHLGMSGRMAVYSEGGARQLGNYHYQMPPSDAGQGKHDHVVFQTDTPALIVFSDPRRFGLMTLADTATLEEHRLFKAIGVEPLSARFNPAFLAQALAGKRTSIKVALADQRLIAGLGNIYVCEALFAAHINPNRMAGSISRERLVRLAAAIKTVLKNAIAAGGSTLRDHAQATGDPGAFQLRFQVYGRAGLPCKLDGKTTIKRIVQGGRSTFYCPKCQK
jgi:formamidopyrimidine-DNA glycosylase